MTWRMQSRRMWSQSRQMSKIQSPSSQMGRMQSQCGGGGGGVQEKVERFESVSEKPAFFVSCQHSLTIKTLRAPVHALPPHSSAYSRSLSLSNVPSKHSLAMKHHIARGGERISGLPGTQNDRTLNTKTSLFLSEGETRPDLVRPLGRALLVQWFICQMSRMWSGWVGVNN